MKIRTIETHTYSVPEIIEEEVRVLIARINSLRSQWSWKRDNAELDALQAELDELLCDLSDLGAVETTAVSVL